MIIGPIAKRHSRRKFWIDRFCFYQLSIQWRGILTIAATMKAMTISKIGDNIYKNSYAAATVAVDSNVA